MKLNFKGLGNRWKELALAGCICVLFFVCITHLGAIFGCIGSFLSLFRTVFIGAIMAYVLHPLAAFFRDHVFFCIKKEKLRWIVSVFITVVIILALLSLLLAMLIPQLTSSVQSLLDNIDSYARHLRLTAAAVSAPVGEFLDNLLNSFVGDYGILSRIGKWITDDIAGLIQTTSNGGSAAVSWLIGAIIAVYLLLACRSMARGAKRLMSLLFKPLTCYRAQTVLNKFNTIFSKYIICELLDALIVGVANFIFMLCTRMPDALFISVIVGITNLAPTFGPIAGAAVGGFILLLVKPGAVLPFLIFTVAIQTVDGYFIKPKLFGGVLNVPGVLILIAIIVFGRLWGVPGMLIAIPAAAILVYLYVEVLIPWLELRQDLKAHRKEMESEKPER